MDPIFVHRNCLSIVFNYTGAPISVKLAPGKYKLEVWGAEGGGTAKDSAKGKGGYSYGIAIFRHPIELYIYIGEGGKTNGVNAATATFNGGGRGGSGYDGWDGGGSGGGGTDFRLIGGNWKDSSSLHSRILVAGGGGGNYHHDGGTAGYGGGEKGGTGIGVRIALPGDQTTGNAFGYGGDGRNGLFADSGYEGNGGGGGGWYGGEAITDSAANTKNPGAGGSGHVNTTYFYIAETIAGNQPFLSPYGVLETGHSGDGAAKITWMDIVSNYHRTNKIKIDYCLFTALLLK